MSGIFVEFFSEGHRIIKIVYEDVVALLERIAQQPENDVPQSGGHALIYYVIQHLTTFCLTQEVKLDSILYRLLGIVHPYGERTSPFQYTVIDGKVSPRHVECTNTSQA